MKKFVCMMLVVLLVCAVLEIVLGQQILKKRSDTHM